MLTELQFQSESVKRTARQHRYRAYFNRFPGIEKVHCNSIKITVDLWQAAPFKITMISPVFSRVSATFGNLFPRWRSVLFNGHCATQKDIA